MNNLLPPFYGNIYLKMEAEDFFDTLKMETAGSSETLIEF
jgi:hypothetical protein